MGDPKITIEIGDSFYTRIEKTIEAAVERILTRNMEKIKAEPDLLTRSEACRRLRITLPTLRKLELDGRLIPERAGRRVLYNKRAIEEFLKN